MYNVLTRQEATYLNGGPGRDLREGCGGSQTPQDSGKATYQGSCLRRMRRTVQRVKANLSCRLPCTLDAAKISTVDETECRRTYDGVKAVLVQDPERSRPLCVGLAESEGGPVRKAGVGAVLQMQA
ncbi:hypothetical protein K439DRAFT_209232 [Ramaria rubella]|nr:hypothetical protein K439DRAFT_209232 [Ramaria rubella]